MKKITTESALWREVAERIMDGRNFYLCVAVDHVAVECDVPDRVRNDAHIRLQLFRPDENRTFWWGVDHYGTSEGSDCRVLAALFLAEMAADDEVEL